MLIGIVVFGIGDGVVLVGGFVDLRVVLFVELWVVCAVFVRVWVLSDAWSGRNCV